MQYFRVNELGEPIDVLENNEEKDPMIVEGWNDSFYYPTYDFETKSWFEGMSEVELDQIKNQPKPITELNMMEKQQMLMQKALDDLILGGML